MSASLGETANRIDYLDCAKGLSLLLVLTLHVNLTSGIWNSFFLGMFFLASGMLFKDDGKSYAENVRRYIKKLMLPYWICMLIFSAEEAFRAPLVGYSSWEIVYASLANTVYGSGVLPNFNSEFSEWIQAFVPHNKNSFSVNIITPSGCHMWFLPAMFAAQIIVLAIMRFRHMIPYYVWIVPLVFAVFLEHLPWVPFLPYCLSRGFLGAAYMLCGICFRQTGILECKNPFVAVPALLICMACVYAADLIGTINYSWILNYYGPYGVTSGIIAFVSGVLGCYAALVLCRMLCLPAFGFIKRILCSLSVHSMVIYIWHLLVFNILAAVYIFLNDGEMTPDIFMMDLISRGDPLYRIGCVLTAAAVLIFASMYWRTLKIRNLFR